MKKLIAFSVIFALLTGAVIAQEFSGWAQVGILNLLGFNGDDLVARGDSGGDEGRKRLDMRMGMNFNNDVAGINLSLRNDGDGTYPGTQWVRFDLASGWWRPVENVLLTIGNKRFSRRLDEHYIWWDYEHDGNARNWFWGGDSDGWGLPNRAGNDGRNIGSSNNWFAIELEDIADMVTLKLSFLNSGIGDDVPVLNAAGNPTGRWEFRPNTPSGTSFTTPGTPPAQDTAEWVWVPTTTFQVDTSFEAQFVDALVVQAVINLGDMGEVGLTFDNWRQIIVADYQGTIADVAIKGAFGFYFDDERGRAQGGDQMWGLGLQANTTIGDIGLMARFNTNMFELMDFLVEAKYDAITAGVGFLTEDLEEFSDTTIIAAYASYEYVYDGIDMFDVKLVPRIDFAFDLGKDDDPIYVGWEIPISLTKSIDGFDFYAGIKLGGTLVDFGGGDVDAFTFTIPVTFRYTW